MNDLTSDVAFEVRGKTFNEVCTDAVNALFTIIAEIHLIEPKIEKKITVTGEDKKDLLFNLLQEIIAETELEECFFSTIEITELSDTNLTAILKGEDMDPAKGNTVVKAITYHKFLLEEKEEGLRAYYTIDI